MINTVLIFLIARIKFLLNSKYNQKEINRIIDILEKLYKGNHYIQWKDYAFLSDVLNHKLIPFSLLRKFISSKSTLSILLESNKISSKNKEFLNEINDKFIENELKVYAKFFDTIESKPLTHMQRVAVITNEKANLIIAGAGSGKTSVIVARTGYVLKKYNTNPEDILLVAFNKSASEEIKERIEQRLSIDSIHSTTFHALGLKIIAESKGIKPSLADWEDSKPKKVKLFWELISKELEDESYLEKVYQFFSYPLSTYKSIFSFEDEIDYKSYVENANLLTLQGGKVNSFEECEIANFLYLNQVKFEYESPYKYNTATATHGQYKPDFYLVDYDIYLEHFGINKNGDTAPFVDKKSYLEGMEWKRALHKKNNTKLIETYSYMKNGKGLINELKSILHENKVALSLMPIEEAIAQLNDSGYINAFADTMSIFISHFKSNRHTFDSLKKRARKDERSLVFLDIAKRICTNYELHKKNNNVIDFNDMIELAINIVQSGEYKSDYKHILVDEFQDISISRAELIRSIFQQNDNSVLTSVGDDWQSINRFAGSEISVFRNFEDFYGDSEEVFLDYTFRYNNRIATASKTFIEENPNQLTKDINTISDVEYPPIKMIWDVKNLLSEIDTILEYISTTKKKSSVMILYRYNFQRLKNLKVLDNKYTEINITQKTIHSSKGLEADYVIVIGMNSGKFGFPSQIEDDPILDLVLAKQENFEHAEERRLFYVALTRAKNEVFLINEFQNPSVFATELLSVKYTSLVTHSHPLNVTPTKCTECASGLMVVKQGKYGIFLGCSNHKYGCKNTIDIDTCPKCFKGIMSKMDNEPYYICNNESCQTRVKTCKSCGGLMIKRKGPRGYFWGCKKWKRDGSGCKYTENI